MIILNKIPAIETRKEEMVLECRKIGWTSSEGSGLVWHDRMESNRFVLRNTRFRPQH